MVSSEPTWHVSRVQKRVSKFVNFKVQKVQKPELFDLTDNGFCSSDARGLYCHIQHLCTIFQSNNVGLGTCEKTYPSKKWPGGQEKHDKGKGCQVVYILKVGTDMNYGRVDSRIKGNEVVLPDLFLHILILS